MRRLAACLLAVVLLVSGACSGGDDDDAGSADVTEGGAGDDDTGGGTDEGAGGGGDAGQLTGQPLTASRSVISRAEVTMVVEDVASAAAEAVAIAEEAGGFQAGGSLQFESEPTGSVELRVPSPRFREALDAIAELGDVADQRITTDDVTAEVVDLEARIATARVSVERVRGFLAEARDVIQLATVEGEVTRREAELEALLGQQRVLADQVDLATIAASFGEEEPPPLDEDPEPSDDIPAPARALRYGWVAFIDAAKVVAAVVAFVSPFAALAVVVLGARRLVRRRRRAARPVDSST